MLTDFDAVFAVIEDRDTEPTRLAVEWAKRRPPRRRCAGVAGATIADR